MAIDLQFLNGIQYISLSDTITQELASAIKLKLDQKVAQGRKYMIFKLDDFDLAQLNLLTEIIQFLKTLGTKVAICGISAGHLKGVEFSTKCSTFLTELEATQFILNLQGNPDTQKSSDQEQDFKIEIEKVIASYEVNFEELELDPFRFVALLSQPQPTSELMKASRNFVNDLEKTRKFNDQLNSEILQIQSQLSSQMALRRIPTAANELEQNMLILNQSMTRIKEESEALERSIRVSKNKIEESKQKSKDHHDSWQKQIAKLEAEVSELLSAHSLAETEMTRARLNEAKPK